MDRATLRDAFAQTYSPPNDIDPGELLDQYRRFVDYQAEHPKAGRYKIANALGIPEGRARSWIDGGMPDVVRGIETATKHGWFQTDGETHLAVTRLVAGIFAAGSVNNVWTPRWSATDGIPVEQDLRQIGAGVKQIDRVQAERGDELEPTTHPRVLGRVLVARGAVKSRNSASTLPSYLFADQSAGRVFVKTYIQARGVTPTDRNHIQIYENKRSDTFHEELAQLVAKHVVGDVSCVKQGIILPPTTVSQTTWLDDD